MIRKLPLDAFTYYASLPPEQRSYRAVAHHYAVSKRTVGKRALREKWRDRMREVEMEVTRRSQDRIVESLVDVNERHLRTLKAVQGKALKSMSTLPHTNAGDAARTLLSALAQERGILEVPGGTGRVVIQVLTGVPRGPGAPEAPPFPHLLPPE